MILSKQVLCTETVFSACLAWRSPDHHWQCNWRVAWTSSRMYAGKRRTLRATIVKYSAIWQETCQFLSNATQFLHLFFWKLPVIRTSKFRKVVWQHTEGMVGSIIRILLEIYFSFQQFRILKIRWELTKLSPWVWCITFLRHSVYISLRDLALWYPSQVKVSRRQLAPFTRHRANKLTNKNNTWAR